MSANKKLLIKNGRIIDPASGIDAKMDVLIGDSKIAALFPSSSERQTTDRPDPEKDLEVIDAEGMVVSPGLIDCHTHFREPGFEYKETIKSGARAAANGGFTSVICEPNTIPAIDTPEMVEKLSAIIAAGAIVNVYTKVCMTEGLRGLKVTDIKRLTENPIVLAVSDDGNPALDDEVVMEAFSAALKGGVPASPHCEDSGYVLGLKSSNTAFSNPPYKNEANYILRDIKCAEETGAALHISHVSLKESMDIIKRAKERNLTKITCEVSPHHLTLDETFIDSSGSNATVNPPLRSRKDVEAMRDALAQGVVDVIACDHAPHSAKDKKGGAFGLIGLETSLGVILADIVNAGVLTINEALKKMSQNPASIFKINGGALAIGMPADITIIDTAREWVVNPDKFESLSKNCPFNGRRLKGKAWATIVGGNVIMKDGELC